VGVTPTRADSTRGEGEGKGEGCSDRASCARERCVVIRFEGSDEEGGSDGG